jgi:formylglycine-generating enzyme required for sulfatase activity
MGFERDRFRFLAHDGAVAFLPANDHETPMDETTARTQAAIAARAGRPVSERTFVVKSPGVRKWLEPTMVAIPPGDAILGCSPDEEGASTHDMRRQVQITHTYALGQHPVTFAEWDAALGAGAQIAKPDDHGWGRGARPVINVSWHDAHAFIAWLNRKAGLEGREDAYRLPTELEWEYACRAGSSTPFHFGDTLTSALANYDARYAYGNGPIGVFRRMTTEVGCFAPNAFGLYDMHGNVWEWCADAWRPRADLDELLAPGGTGKRLRSHVLRGGSWNEVPHFLRSAYRDGLLPTVRYYTIGFRLARTITP